MLYLNVTQAEYFDLYKAVEAAERPAVFAEQSPYLDIGQYHAALDQLFGIDAAQQILEAMRRRECVRVVVVHSTPHNRITPSP